MLDCCLFILSKFKFSLDLHYSKYCVIYHTNTYVRRRGQTYHNIIIHIIKRFSSCAAKQTNKHTHTRTHAHTWTHAHTSTHGHTYTQAHHSSCADKPTNKFPPSNLTDVKKPENPPLPKGCRPLAHQVAGHRYGKGRLGIGPCYYCYIPEVFNF